MRTEIKIITFIIIILCIKMNETKEVNKETIDKTTIKLLLKALSEQQQVNNNNTNSLRDNLNAYPHVSQYPKRNISWKECIEIPYLGKSCIEIYGIIREIKIGVRLIIRDRIIMDESFGGNKLCLNDDALLNLISTLPPLLPFKPVIDQLR
jgi:hypothetical protein